MTVGLLDTSALVLLDRIPVTALPDEIRISAVTLAEIAAGPSAATTSRELSLRVARLQHVESAFIIVPFDADCSRAFALVADDLRRSGRKAGSRAFDALIGATSIAHGLPLYTCNPRDFDGIDGIDLVAIPHPVSP